VVLFVIFLGKFPKKSTLQFETKTSVCFEVRSAFHMADNDNVSVSEARIDASSPGTGQTIAETHAAEDVHNEATTPKTGIIDTSATTNTTDVQQRPPKAVAMPSESQPPPSPPPEQENAVSSQQNGDVAEREEHGDTNNVSVLSSDRPPLRDEGFEEVRLDTEGQDKLPQGKNNLFLTLCCLCHFSTLTSDVDCSRNPRYP
jgi:hypothetical protein